MDFIKNILKGMVVGIANIIPGVSGGTLMVSMNIYDRLIHSITHLFSEFKKAMVFLIPLFLGIGIALIVSSFGIKAMFANFPIQTNLFFIGLILGGLPVAVKTVKNEKIKPAFIVCFLVFFIIVVGLAAFGNTGSNDAGLSTNVGGIIILFLVGVIASATMVIPGVSGSMILLLLGYYNPIINTVTEFFTALSEKDMPTLIHDFMILFPFGLGVLFGIFAIAKIIEIVFEKFPLHAQWAIIGLIVSSPFAIILMNDFSGINVVSILTGIVALAVGVGISMKLGE